MRRILSYCVALFVGVGMIVVGMSAALAAGIASEGKSLGGMSDRQCLVRVDGVIADERRAAPNLLAVVGGDFTRRVIYDDGTVDFACFPNQVVIIVFFSNAGNVQAEADLENFLRNF